METSAEALDSTLSPAIILSGMPYEDAPATRPRSGYSPDHSAFQGVVSSSVLTLEADTSDLQTATPALQSQLSSFLTVEELKGHSSSPSPLRQLPDELLEEIFAYVCPAEPIQICKRAGAIWDLQQVCVRWREIVRGTSPLWCTFRVADEVEVSRAAIALRIQTCLQLSGTALLSIYIMRTSLLDFSYHVVEDIANHADRWASLTIDGFIFGQAPEIAELYELICQRGLSQLRKLSIDGDGCAITIFDSATALEEVNITDITHFFPSQLHWTNVRIFSINNCAVAAGGEMISAFVTMSNSLEEFTWMDSDCTLEFEPLGAITFPSLHTITVLDTRPWNVPDSIWPIFRVPSLTKIRIIDDIPDFKFRPLLTMVQTSGSFIKRLQLDSCSTGFFLEAIKVFCKIGELTLVGTKDSYDGLSRLIRDPMSDPETISILPSLRKLELYICSSEDEIIVSSVMAVMRSRSSTSTEMIKESTSLTVVPLSFVKYYTFRPVLDSTIAQLVILGEELGIEVEAEAWDVSGYEKH